MRWMLNWDNHKDRLKIIEKYLPSAYDEALALTNLADVLDPFDTWMPWMIEEIYALRKQVTDLKKRTQTVSEDW